MLTNQVILGTYNHMAEGIAESEFERTYQECWRPFLATLYRFPEVRAVSHYSGTVLKWLELRHPEFLMLMEEMVLRRQVELLGGGFFSPIMPIIPASDRLGQIEMLTTHIRKTFGKRPMGGWLHEYAWEPGLASLLQTCGFDYTFLPERIFLQAGIDPARLGTPMMTEDQGKTVAVYPVFDLSESLESPLPFEAAYEAVSARARDLPLYVLMLDGNLAGRMWAASGLESPDVMFERTYAWFKKNMLEIETTTASRHFRSMRRFESAYFPGSASRRLMQASLPRGCADAADPLAATPRRVVIRSESSLSLYSKMQYVHLLAGQVRGDKARKKSAHEELWRGQCGEAYWQGGPGGTGRPGVRAAAFSSLIDAEKTTRLRGSFLPGLLHTDLDFDGEREILFQGTETNCYVHLRGGTLFELDSFRTRTNYAGVPDAGGDRSRRCFQDSICARGGFGGRTADFSALWYSIWEGEANSHAVVLTREGHAATESGHADIALRKTFVFLKNGLSVEYEIGNREDYGLPIRFVTELNLSGAADTGSLGIGIVRGRERFPAPSSVTTGHDGCDGFTLEPHAGKESIEARSDQPFALVHEPLYSECPADDEKPSYRGSGFKCGWDLEIPPAGTRRISLTLEIRQ